MFRALIVTTAIVVSLTVSQPAVFGQGYYRLKDVTVPEFVTDKNAWGYESIKQASLKHEARAEWIKKGEIYKFSTREKDPNLVFTVNLVKGTIHVNLDHKYLKGVIYNWHMTYTLPPRVIRKNQVIELKSTVKGEVHMDHYGEAHPPMRPCFYADSRLLLQSSSGLGNPVLHQDQQWKWPKLQKNGSGAWSGSAKFKVDTDRKPNSRSPFVISVGAPNGGSHMSFIRYRYEYVAGNPTSESGNRSGGGNTGSNRSGGTENGNRDRNGNGSSGRIETIIEEGTRHGTPAKRSNSGNVSRNTTGNKSGNVSRKATGETILEANRVRVRPNQTVRLRIDLKNANDVSNMNFDALFSSSVAQPVGKAYQGGLISSQRFEVNQANPGKIRVGFAGERGVTGTGSVAYIEFRAVGRPGDRTPVTFNVTTSNHTSGQQASVTQIPGEILIVNENGFMPGDIDGSGEIDERDAGDALKMSVGLIPVNMVADVDQNGQVTSRDATLIMQMVRDN